MLTWIYEFATTRELAITIWTVLLVLALLFMPSMQRSSEDVLRSFLNWRVWIPLLFYAAYLSLVVFVLWWLGFWVKALLGATVIWFLASGLALVVTAVTDAPKQVGFFRKNLIATAGLTVLVEAVVNSTTFTLWVELLLFPTLVILICAQWAALHRTDTVKIGLVLAFLLLTFVLALAAFTLWELLQSPQGDWGELFREIFLPIVLGIATLPFAYVFSLYATYQAMFVALRNKSAESSVSLRARLGLVSALLGNIRLIHEFTKHNKRKTAQVGTYRSARALVKQHKSTIKKQEESRAQVRQRLKDFAGVSGVDSDGKQIDRREFAETKDALEWLHLCMAGHYRNREFYRTDMLDFLQSFADRGLEDPHGITLQVKPDGQAWHAYRETPSGYTLGIGGNGPPHYRWFYGALEAPTNFPDSGRHEWTSEVHTELHKEWEDEPES